MSYPRFATHQSRSQSDALLICSVVGARSSKRSQLEPPAAVICEIRYPEESSRLFMVSKGCRAVHSCQRCTTASCSSHEICECVVRDLKLQSEQSSHCLLGLGPVNSPYECFLCSCASSLALLFKTSIPDPAHPVISIFPKLLQVNFRKIRSPEV